MGKRMLRSVLDMRVRLLQDIQVEVSAAMNYSVSSVQTRRSSNSTLLTKVFNSLYLQALC